MSYVGASINSGADRRQRAALEHYSSTTMVLSTARAGRGGTVYAIYQDVAVTAEGVALCAATAELFCNGALPSAKACH